MPTISKKNLVLQRCKQSSAIENFVPTVHKAVKDCSSLVSDGAEVMTGQLSVWGGKWSEGFTL